MKSMRFPGAVNRNMDTSVGEIKRCIEQTGRKPLVIWLDIFNIITIITTTIYKSHIFVWAGHVVRIWEKTNAYRILVGEPEGKRPLGRPKRRWVNNIKMGQREIG
jgi:hypothetical protein